MATATQQIQSAVQRLAPQIYRATMMQPTAAGRAQVLRMILVGVDPALSERVAAAVPQLEARGYSPRQAVLQAISNELGGHMRELAELEGLGMEAAQITSLISGITAGVTQLTQTAGNIAVSSMQARRRQTVTGMPSLQQTVETIASGGAAPAAGPANLGPYGQTVQGRPSPPWGWIVGGVGAAAVVLGGIYYVTKAKKPAVKAAA